MAAPALSPAPPDGSQMPVSMPRMVEMLASGSNSAPFAQFSATILDKRFAELWAPHLNELPIVQFQRSAQDYCKPAQ